MNVSVSILGLNLILGGIVYLMASDQGIKHYPGYLIYGVAFYAFCKVIAGGRFHKEQRRDDGMYGILGHIIGDGGHEARVEHQVVDLIVIPLVVVGGLGDDHIGF